MPRRASNSAKPALRQFAVWWSNGECFTASAASLSQAVRPYERGGPVDGLVIVCAVELKHVAKPSDQTAPFVVTVSGNKGATPK